MSEKFHIKEYPNGLTLLAQPMEGVSSAAITFAVPAGASLDPDAIRGAASVGIEWRLRGAGDRNTRQLNDALGALGCQHGESVRSRHAQLSASLLGRNLAQVLAIYSDILIRPKLEDETFAQCRALILQDLQSLEDEPAQKCNIMLQEHYYPDPLGKCAYGNADSLEAMTPASVREHLTRAFTPDGTVLAVAGNIQWDALCSLVDEHFAPWAGQARMEVTPRMSTGGVTHIHKDSAQTHIALAHAAVPVSDERYCAARVAETVLSAGMSSRLMTEVREKRGLVYHVSCRYHSLKDHAGMFTYAGTVPEKAQETFDVTTGELLRLGEGIQEHEMARAKTQLKSSLVMQGESTGARAGALAGDWYHRKRLRGLREISEDIDRTTTDDVVDYLRAFPAENFTILVIGPEPIDPGAAGNGNRP